MHIILFGVTQSINFSKLKKKKIQRLRIERHVILLRNWGGQQQADADGSYAQHSAGRLNKYRLKRWLGQVYKHLLSAYNVLETQRWRQYESSQRRTREGSKTYQHWIMKRCDGTQNKSTVTEAHIQKHKMPRAQKASQDYWSRRWRRGV